MYRYEFLEHERTFKKSAEEQRQESNSTNIAKCLKGQQYSEKDNALIIRNLGRREDVHMS